MFTVEKLSLPGVLLIKPKIFNDVRGYSVAAYDALEFAKLGITTTFTQDFRSHSIKDVIRGLHFQHAPYEQEKLVRCAEGEIFDIVADIDPASPTFGTHVSVVLTAESQDMLYVPGKYAHGFCVLSEGATVEYKIAGEYNPEKASGILWNDPRLNIAWPTQNPILSPKDTSWKPLNV